MLTGTISLVTGVLALLAAGAATSQLAESLTARRRRLELLDLAVQASIESGQGVVADSWQRIVRHLVRPVPDRGRLRARRLATLLAVLVFTVTLAASSVAAYLHDGPPISTYRQPSPVDVTGILFVYGLAYFSFLAGIIFLGIRMRQTVSRSSANAR